ncbi:MAG: hypothetical protein FJ271_25470 [Planctomycetes bacterium]|nr:hypothetical protein [Planctomycetota bacterium]
MPAKKKPIHADSDLQSLKRENASLREQMRALRDERDCYLRALHTWAKKKLTPQSVKRAMAGRQVPGSLTSFIREVDEEG